jgi:hypothetical protein
VLGPRILESLPGRVISMSSLRRGAYRCHFLCSASNRLARCHAHIVRLSDADCNGSRDMFEPSEARGSRPSWRSRVVPRLSDMSWYPSARRQLVGISVCFNPCQVIRTGSGIWTPTPAPWRPFLSRGGAVPRPAVDRACKCVTLEPQCFGVHSASLLASRPSPTTRNPRHVIWTGFMYGR